MPFRLMEVLRKSVAMLAVVGACVWGLGCNQDAAKPSKPAANTADSKKPEDKPAEKKPETGAAGSTTGAGGGTQTP